MLHNRRVWCLSVVPSVEELAQKLTETTWCCCTAFQLGRYLFLNDSTSPDGIQEYAIVMTEGEGSRVQIESITFGWCDAAKALEYIRDIVVGRYDRSEFRRSVDCALQSPEEHGRCTHCA